jgi:predicted dehydrogenase
MSYELPEPGMGSMTLVAVGTKAMLRVDMYGKVELSHPDGTWELVLEQGPFDPLNAVDPIRLRAYAGQMEDLVAAIAERRDPYVSGRQGLITTSMLEAAERSAATNQVINLPL